MIGHHARLRDMTGSSYPIYACAIGMCNAILRNHLKTWTNRVKSRPKFDQDLNL